jgi:tRNA threonylcarbamoyladenosine biosynthesis protein TsaE
VRILNTYKIKTNNEIETKAIAEELATELQPGAIITLSGNLGVGKTTFTKGLAMGLDIKQAVTSPTFTIIKEYSGKIPLYHIDAYRLEHSDEDIGFDEYFYGKGITVVEWASFIEAFLPIERLAIEIKPLKDSTRQLVFTAIGEHYEILLENLAAKKGNES